jgi:two-component system, cell cycle response regulator
MMARDDRSEPNKGNQRYSWKQARETIQKVRRCKLWSREGKRVSLARDPRELSGRAVISTARAGATFLFLILARPIPVAASGSPAYPVSQDLIEPVPRFEINPIPACADQQRNLTLNWLQGAMHSPVRNLAASLWSRPDPVLAQAAVAGELLVARVRLGLAAVLLLIPLIDAFFFPDDPREAIVGLSLTGATFLLSLIVFVLIRREYNPPWLSFATSSFDVTLVSGALALFLVMNEPHTAVNSKVVFEGYFLALASTSLRYDKRICITVGVLAFGEYLSIISLAATHWDLNNAKYAPFVYGQFAWSNQVSRLIIMLTAAMLSLALVSRSQRLLEMATRDPLTGLFNRGYVDDRFAVELSRARRYRTPLTIAVIDADRFKSLNDAHGHAAGDQVLRSIGSLLRDSFRQSDTAGRYGGEEFIVILPETDLESAQAKIESLRESVGSIPFVLGARGEEVQVTISAGLACFPDDALSSADLFAVADERMFQAKRAGRNRVSASA